MSRSAQAWVATIPKTRLALKMSISFATSGRSYVGKIGLVAALARLQVRSVSGTMSYVTLVKKSAVGNALTQMENVFAQRMTFYVVGKRLVVETSASVHLQGINASTKKEQDSTPFAAKVKASVDTNVTIHKMVSVSQLVVGAKDSVRLAMKSADMHVTIRSRVNATMIISYVPKRKRFVGQPATRITERKSVTYPFFVSLDTNCVVRNSATIRSSQSAKI